MGLKREQLWRAQYRLRRYLEYLKEEHLVRRLKDILGNSIVVTDKGQFSVRPVSGKGSIG